jgi:hypothetical protein
MTSRSSFEIGICPVCSQPAVLFIEYSTAAALRAYAELKKRPGFAMVNTRPHDLPKKGKPIWHVIEREVQHEA